MKKDREGGIRREGSDEERRRVSRTKRIETDHVSLTSSFHAIICSVREYSTLPYQYCTRSSRQESKDKLCCGLFALWHFKAKYTEFALYCTVDTRTRQPQTPEMLNILRFKRHFKITSHQTTHRGTLVPSQNLFDKHWRKKQQQQKQDKKKTEDKRRSAVVVFGGVC